MTCMSLKNWFQIITSEKYLLKIMYFFQYFKTNFFLIFILVLVGAHQEEGSWTSQAQVHRHQLQDGSWSLPDQEGQNGLHGTPQEGRCQDRSCSLKSFLNRLLLTSFLSQLGKINISLWKTSFFSRFFDWFLALLGNF